MYAVALQNSASPNKANPRCNSLNDTGEDIG